MQPSLITLANDSQVKRPGGVGIQRQFYRDKSSQGSGIYKAMDENGNVEIIGGPGAGIFPVYQNGTFTLSADGLVGSGEVGGAPATYNPVTKVMTFTTTKELKLWHGITTQQNPFGSTSFSDGRSDGVIQNSSVFTVILGFPNQAIATSDFINTINVSDANTGDGWTGIITDIRATEFDITFTQLGIGLEIKGQMHLIEG